LVTLLSGCNSHGPGKEFKPPKPPPAYPASAPMAIDPGLRDAAEEEVDKAFHSPTAVMRADALETMRQTRGRQEINNILTGLGDEVVVVRFAACMAVGELRLRQARPQVMELAYDKDPTVRVAAHYALHCLGDKRLSHDFEVFAKSPDADVRATTAQALGLLGEPTAVRILHQMMHDPEPRVRIQTFESLWRLEDSTGLNSLVGLTLSGYPDEQMAGIIGLSVRNDQRVIEHIRGSLVTDYQEVNLIAARAMGQLGSDEGYGVATLAAGSKDPRIRSLAALALGAIGRADSQPLLQKLLNDVDANVRLAAATGILQLKGE